jgi:hypothetical protein
MKNLLFFSLIVLFTVSSCREIGGRRIRGSRNITTETRTASDFDGVMVSGAIDLYVKQDSTTSIKIEADDNLQEYIEVHTDGSILEIHTKRGVNLRPSHSIKVYISNPAFKHLEASGACSINGESTITSTDMLNVHLTGASSAKLEMDAPKISAEVTGASNLNLRGKTRDFEADASGASEIKGYDLLTENTYAEISGASSLQVYASVKVQGSASGASNIKYKGNAANSVSSSGASGVNKVE